MRSRNQTLLKHQCSESGWAESGCSVDDHDHRQPRGFGRWLQEQWRFVDALRADATMRCGQRVCDHGSDVVRDPCLMLACSVGLQQVASRSQRQSRGGIYSNGHDLTRLQSAVSSAEVFQSSEFSKT